MKGLTLKMFVHFQCSCPVEILRYGGRFIRIEQCQTTGVSKQIDTVAPLLKILVLKGDLYGWNSDFLHVYHIVLHCSCPVEI